MVVAHTTIVTSMRSGVQWVGPFHYVPSCRAKKPRGAELTREQHLTNQALHQRRLRIEHVNSSVKRCGIVKDRIRLWKQGVRDLVMELCCALHNFRVRLTASIMHRP